jgi:hypothetical protein
MPRYFQFPRRRPLKQSTSFYGDLRKTIKTHRPWSRTENWTFSVSQALVASLVLIRLDHLFEAVSTCVAPIVDVDISSPKLWLNSDILLMAQFLGNWLAFSRKGVDRHRAFRQLWGKTFIRLSSGARYDIEIYSTQLHLVDPVVDPS